MANGRDINTQIGNIAGNASGLPEASGFIANAGTPQNVAGRSEIGAQGGSGFLQGIGGRFKDFVQSVASRDPANKTAAQTAQLNEQTQALALQNEEDQRFTSLEDFTSNFDEVDAELYTDILKANNVISKDANGTEGFTMKAARDTLATLLDEPHEIATHLDKKLNKEQTRFDKNTKMLNNDLQALTEKDPALTAKDRGTDKYKAKQAEIKRDIEAGILNDPASQAIREQMGIIQGQAEKIANTRVAQNQMQNQIQRNQRQETPQNRFIRLRQQELMAEGKGQVESLATAIAENKDNTKKPRTPSAAETKNTVQFQKDTSEAKKAANALLAQEPATIEGVPVQNLEQIQAWLDANYPNAAAETRKAIQSEREL